MPVRPADPMRRLQARFPHCVHLEWAGPAAPADGAQLPGAAARPQRPRGRRRVRHATSAPCRPPPPSATLLAGALAAAARAEAGRMRLHSLSLTAFGPFPDTGRGRPRRGRPRRALPAVGPDRRGQDDAARRGRLRALRHRARAPAARRSGCAATTPAPTSAPRSAAS